MPHFYLLHVRRQSEDHVRGEDADEGDVEEEEGEVADLGQPPLVSDQSEYQRVIQQFGAVELHLGDNVERDTRMERGLLVYLSKLPWCQTQLF